MSEKLNWSDAKNMLIAYQNNNRALKVDPPNGTEILKGFKVDRADMEWVLNYTGVVDVIIMPAVKLEDLSKPENEQEFTLIVSGLDDNGDIVEAATIEFLVPCPTVCPRNFPSK